MAIKKIDYAKCEVCELRIKDTCPIMESCFQAVIKLDEEKKPHIAYPKDCIGCYRYYFACQEDCPYDAVTVSADFRFPRLPF